MSGLSGSPQTQRICGADLGASGRVRHVGPDTPRPRRRPPLSYLRVLAARLRPSSYPPRPPAGMDLGSLESVGLPSASALNAESLARKDRRARQRAREKSEKEAAPKEVVDMAASAPAPSATPARTPASAPAGTPSATPAPLCDSDPASQWGGIPDGFTEDPDASPETAYECDSDPASQKIHACYHEHKHYMVPHPIHSDRNASSLQHRWAAIQESVNKFCGAYAQVVNRNQSGIGVDSHIGLAATLYHQIEKKPFTLSHCWLELQGKPKWTNLFEDLKNPNKKKKNNDGSSSHQSIGLDDDDESSGGATRLGTEPKRSRHMRGKKWEKDRVARRSGEQDVGHVDRAPFQQRGTIEEIGGDEGGEEGGEIQALLGCAKGADGIR